MILWMSFPILSTIAVNKLTFLYDEKTNRAGFELKRGTWGPSYKDTKKIAKLTQDEYVRKKAKESIRLWRISFSCFFFSIILFFIIGFLNKP